MRTVFSLSKSEHDDVNFLKEDHSQIVVCAVHMQPGLTWHAWSLYLFPRMWGRWSRPSSEFIRKENNETSPMQEGPSRVTLGARSTKGLIASPE